MMFPFLISQTFRTKKHIEKIHQVRLHMLNMFGILKQMYDKKIHYFNSLMIFLGSHIHLDLPIHKLTRDQPPNPPLFHQNR